MRATGWRSVLAVLAVLCAAVNALALDVGEKAPELNVTEWVQGEPVKLADGAGTKVWLVVFWGTFEADCIEAMPTLNKVLEKHKAAGFDVVAISTEASDIVKRFLADHKLDYRVAIDQFHATRDAYHKEMPKLPWGCIVDKTGTIVWTGEPGGHIEGLVGQILEGKFDLKRAKETAARQQEFFEALVRNDWDKLADLCDKALAADPKDQQAYSFRVWAFQAKGDQEGYKKFLRAHAERVKDDAGALSRIASSALNEGRNDWRDVDLAYTTAKRAVEVSKSADADVLAVYAEVLFTAGLPDLAVEQQKKAVAADAKDEDLKKTLAWYEACVAARKKAGAPPAPPKKK